MSDSFRIGIVSGKLGGVDGVSLEVNKWIHILNQMKHEIFTVAGSYPSVLPGVPENRQTVLDKLAFDCPEQKFYEKRLFPFLTKNPPQINDGKEKDIVDDLLVEGGSVANALNEFIKENDIDVIIGENTNAMPMTLLGAIAVHKNVTDKRVATIFHHHDFWWERSRFSHNHIESLLNKIMPPSDLGLEHVVISSYAAHILTSLKRIQPHVIPNCEDFENPVGLDEYNSDFRQELGFREDDLIILQPTRIVRRKRIEDAVRLVGLLIRKYPNIADRVKYVISLYQGDEHDENYVEEIKNLSEELGVSLHLISERVSALRRTDVAGRKLYTNRDVIANADLVTYLPVWEGFGNALLESVAGKVPVVVTTYLVYKTDIKISGVQNIEIRDSYDTHGRLVIPEAKIDEIYDILTHPDKRKEIVDSNFTIAEKEFGLSSLKQKLEGVFSEYADEIRASRKRIQKSKRLYSV